MQYLFRYIFYAAIAFVLLGLTFIIFFTAFAVSANRSQPEQLSKNENFSKIDFTRHCYDCQTVNLESSDWSCGISFPVSPPKASCTKGDCGYPVYKKPEFNMPDLSPPPFQSLEISLSGLHGSVNDHHCLNRHHRREIPEFPKHAKRSGHCVFSATIGTDGKAAAIDNITCSETVFKAYAEDAIKRSIFCKTDESGNPVPFELKNSRISWRLTDKDGNIIPEAE